MVEARSSGSCVATAPTEIAGGTARWLGSCPAGRAEGLGVLRVGAREPFGFLVGRMKAGRPVSGLIFKPSGNYMEAVAFDGRGRAILADGEHVQQEDALWATAARAARNVAERFADDGNRNSASYYRRLAYRIEHDRPE